ncbi:MAG: methyltransferase domain-containing protein, partial [Planctomycetota bacterium]
ESGGIKALGKITAKTQVEQLDQILKSAQYERLRKKYPSYGDYEQHKEDPITAEDVQYANYPNISVHESNYAGMKRDLREFRGGKKLANQIHATTIDFKLAKKILDFAKKYRIKTLPWTIESNYKEVSAMRRMGIENTEQLKDALTELVDLRAGRKKEDPIKAMERELIGTKIQGFFPTPEALAERMVDEAQLKEGMDILEPSAGVGSIADAIRKDGFEPDVIEIVPQLKQILGAKNYEVVSSDFLEFDAKKYDRIIMNPPFEKGQDVEHVKHAYDLLKPDGRIVAIMGEGSFFRSDKKSQGFRDWLDEVDGFSEQLESGTFKGAKQLRETGVVSRLVIIGKEGYIAKSQAKIWIKGKEEVTPEQRSTEGEKAGKKEAEAFEKKTTPTKVKDIVEAYKKSEIKPSDGSWDRSAVNNYADKFIKALATRLAKGEWKTQKQLQGGVYNRTKSNAHKDLKKLRELGIVQIAWNKEGEPYYALSDIKKPDHLMDEAEADKFIAESPKEQAAQKPAPTKKEKPQPLGTVWTGNNWRPFMEQREIKKGKHKGKLEVTLPDGKKIKVDKDALRYAEPEEQPKAAVPSEKETTGIVQAKPSDISRERARRAHLGTSFVPEERAEQEQQEYVNYFNNTYDTLKKLAETDEQKATLNIEMQRYKEGLLKRFNALLDAKSRTMSSMITGPARFPTKRNQKALDAETRKYNEFTEWNRKAQKAIKKKIRPDLGPISSDNPDAIKLLEDKIADAEKLQETMKGVNKIARSKKLTDEQKIEQIKKDFEFSTAYAEEILKPDYMGREGFAPYQLQNNNANIKRMKERVVKLEKQQSDETTELEIGDVQIIDNVEDNRVQIFFPGKPDTDVRKQLKQNGFRWAPSVGAWQRHRSDVAMRLAKEIIGAESKPKFQRKDRLSPLIQKSTIEDAVKPIWDSWRG